MSEVDHRIHEASRLEIGAELGQLLAELLADAPHVFVAADFVALLQAHLHKSGVGSGVWSVDGGKIGGDADVGDDDLQLVFRHYRANDLLRPVSRILRSARRAFPRALSN